MLMPYTDEDAMFCIGPFLTEQVEKVKLEVTSSVVTLFLQDDKVLDAGIAMYICLCPAGSFISNELTKALELPKLRILVELTIISETEVPSCFIDITPDK